MYLRRATFFSFIFRLYFVSFFIGIRTEQLHRGGVSTCQKQRSGGEKNPQKRLFFDCLLPAEMWLLVRINVEVRARYGLDFVSNSVGTPFSSLRAMFGFRFSFHTLFLNPRSYSRFHIPLSALHSGLEFAFHLPGLQVALYSELYS